MKNKNKEKIDTIINELIVSKSQNISLSKMNKEEDLEVEIITENPTYNKKYREALKMSIKLDVQELKITQPKASAKEVLTAILTEYDTDISAPILLDMAKTILKEWEAMQTAHNKLVVA